VEQVANDRDREPDESHEHPFVPLTPIHLSISIEESGKVGWGWETASKKKIGVGRKKRMKVAGRKGVGGSDKGKS